MQRPIPDPPHILLRKFRLKRWCVANIRHFGRRQIVSTGGCRKARSLFPSQKWSRTDQSKHHIHSFTTGRRTLGLKSGPRYGTFFKRKLSAEFQCEMKSGVRKRCTGSVGRLIPIICQYYDLCDRQMSLCIWKPHFRRNHGRHSICKMCRGVKMPVTFSKNATPFGSFLEKTDLNCARNRNPNCNLGNLSRDPPAVWSNFFTETIAFWSLSSRKLKFLGWVNELKYLYLGVPRRWTLSQEAVWMAGL